jgi:hypothetical protein
MERNSPTALRIQALVRFRMGYVGAAWDDRFSEFVDYRKKQRAVTSLWCYSENIQLGQWVGTQRKEYRLHQRKEIAYDPFESVTLKA